MSASGVIAYRTDSGELRGTYVNDDSYPCLAIRNLNCRIERFGVEGLHKWIEEGVKAGGYRDWSTDNPVRHALPRNERVDNHDYGYLLNAFGQIQLVHKHSPGPHCDDCSRLMQSMRPY